MISSSGTRIGGTSHDDHGIRPDDGEDMGRSLTLVSKTPRADVTVT
jgi:hypothetical protein